ncbi:MAG: cell wall-active antibiotics response protein [Actinomycetia bacterium]|nr:cell wall-active antibiotics response protein [Actinomycetes bacterium]
MGKKVNINLGLKVIIGLVVICAGILFLLKNLGVAIEINIWDLWPVALILIGLSHVSRPGETRQAFSGAVFIIVGVLLLLNNLDIIFFNVGTFWPIIVILLGIAILKDAVWGSRKAPSSSDNFDLSFILGGGEYRFASDQFRGGKLVAFMGGGTIDLRDADIQIDDHAVIDLFAFMGGIDIIVPRHWDVNIQGTPILGGIDNKTVVMSKEEIAAHPEKAIKKLTIKGMAVMGGIEVKN